MTTYALIENGSIASVGLPNVGTLADGRKVSNFDKLDEETLRDAGWVPVEDPGPPDHDPMKTSVNRLFSVQDDRVVITYSVEELPPPAPPKPTPPTTEEILDNLLLKLEEKKILTPQDVAESRKPRTPTPR